MQTTLGIALLGFGTVGASVAERLIRDRDAFERRSGVRYELRGIAIRDVNKTRPPFLDARIFTRDARALIDDPKVDIVIECVGGTSDAAEFVERALDRGRHVVTANKDLLATQGPRLQTLAATRRVELKYEAAACGAIPVVRTLGDALAGDHIAAIAGVMNGTTTAILSSIESGSDFAEALADAQRRGYAEADPASDVQGHDATHKLALLVQLAFGLAVISPRIRRRGITDVTKDDVAQALAHGYRIRLVGAAIRTRSGAAADVGPVLVPQDHPFAKATGADNVVLIEARDAGSLFLSGAGAGGAATASAVLGDLVTVLRAVGERHDLATRGRTRALEPAIVVSPFFASLPRYPRVPHYPLWDDHFLTTSLSNAPASHDDAYSLPGKEH